MGEAGRLGVELGREVEGCGGCFSGFSGFLEASEMKIKRFVSGTAM